MEPSVAGNVRAVAFDVDRPETLADAIGDAKVVVSCLGAPESEIFDVDAPRRIDGQGTSALVRAAADLGVEHFVMVSSLGAGRFGMPASLLNAWGKVAELIGEVVQHPTCSTHKTLEVVAEKGVPKADAMELLGRIPVEHVGDGLEGTTEYYQSKYKYDPKKEGATTSMHDQARPRKKETKQVPIPPPGSAWNGWKETGQHCKECK
eukprot:jgi/Pico_ML_1/55154/g890.t2